MPSESIPTHASRLGSPLDLRRLRVPNRVVVSPMCQYSAVDGMANDWHLAHLGRFAIGGAGLVFVEATAVVPEGRITHGDTGLWNDQQIAPLKRVADFIKSCGSVPAIQLAHAGRKASMQRPWHGHGPLNEADIRRGEEPWPIVAPSPAPVADGWLEPRALDRDDMRRLCEAWATAARRAGEAGFEAVELHAAHGYLLHTFLSPLSNQRNDAYGGDFEGRCRFPLEVADALRRAWPSDKPLFVRLSAVDGAEDGWAIEDTVRLARRLKDIGVDVVDCSSGGLGGSATAARQKRTPGFQVPFAEAVRREADLPTMAVGLILDARQAEDILRREQADLIALAREILVHPNWALQSIMELEESEAPTYARWPNQSGWWLARRHGTYTRDRA